MQLLDWPFIDALQTGALAALFFSFGADAFTRRDKMMGLLALTCLLVGFRHGVLAFAAISAPNPDLVDRAQSLLVAFGFIALSGVVSNLFPTQVPRHFPGWIALAMIPNLIRNLVLPHPSQVDLWLHHTANLTYLVGCGFILFWTLRARQDGDPMARQLFFGFLGVTLPVVVEIAALSLFGLKIRLSGFSLMILAMFIGISRQALVVNAMESRIKRAERESEAWLGLIPGQAFRTDRPSSTMDGLFGTDWSDRVKTSPDEPLTGLDGTNYRIHTRVLYHQERVGWCAREEDTRPGQRGFLAGWTVGLGMDTQAECARIHALLQSWGADVQLWGTIPPREGPYPSVLLWAREPSILAVWREDDLLHRRPRWVQIGGPITEGPHARLEPGASEESLRRVLEELLSRH